MNVFDILGPVMIGPSSSHTAGAAKIGRLAGIILGEKPVRADIFLHGSFAATYRGHGSDRALVGGLLGFAADDERLRDALDIAVREGLSVRFYQENLGDVHPNTVKITATGISGKTIDIVASSIGGGDIKVINLLGFTVDFDGQSNTMIIPHLDQPGIVAAVTAILAEEGVNIAQMKVTREVRGSNAIMIIETDQLCDQVGVEKMENLPSVLGVILVKPIQ
jgi:L-serine dehydratase